MGFNTVAVLFNDHQAEIARQMPRLAAAMRSYHSDDKFDRWFGSGAVISMSHADDNQVVVVNRNAGRRLTTQDPAEADDLQALSEILRAHGYSVKAPGGKLRGPSSWGYAAKVEASKAGG